MNKLTMKNRREPGNAPGKLAADEENSLNVANISGNQLGNASGFEGGSGSEVASFARNANVTTPTNTTEVGFGSARQSNPDGGGDNNTPEARVASNNVFGKQSSAAVARMKERNASKVMNNNSKFKNQKLNKITDKFAANNTVSKNKGYGNALSTNSAVTSKNKNA